MLEILWEAPPQYTARGKKTLMVSCKCLACWSIRDFRKTRVTTWITKTCWCSRKSVFSKWDKSYGFTYLAEAPLSVEWRRRLYVACVCWDKAFIDVLDWWFKRDCGCKKYKK